MKITVEAEVPEGKYCYFEGSHSCMYKNKEDCYLFGKLLDCDKEEDEYLKCPTCLEACKKAKEKK
jgi:hypothetical protein